MSPQRYFVKTVCVRDCSSRCVWMRGGEGRGKCMNIEWRGCVSMLFCSVLLS